jgi:hypothetical protein
MRIGLQTRGQGIQGRVVFFTKMIGVQGDEWALSVNPRCNIATSSIGMQGGPSPSPTVIGAGYSEATRGIMFVLFPLCLCHERTITPPQNWKSVGLDCASHPSQNGSIHRRA